MLDLRGHGEPGGRIGLVLSCAGVGAIVGALLAPKAVARLSPPAILLGIGAGWAVVLGVFGIDYALWQTAACLTILMTLSPAAGVVVGHALYSRCPRELVGRVSAATSILLSGLAAIGPLLAGALFEGLGGRGAWLVLGGVTAAVTIAWWVPLQASRDMKPPAEPEPSAEPSAMSSAEPATAGLFETDFSGPDDFAGAALDEADLYDVVAHALPAPSPSPPLTVGSYPLPFGTIGQHEPDIWLRRLPGRGGRS